VVSLQTGKARLRDELFQSHEILALRHELLMSLCDNNVQLRNEYWHACGKIFYFQNLFGETETHTENKKNGA
jgi:hypothetical protein